MVPIHAAGYHKHSTRNVFVDRVISSYLLTIKSLAYARERVTTASVEKDQHALLVGTTQTPNQSSLAYVDREIDNVHALLKQNCSNYGT